MRVVVKETDMSAWVRVIEIEKTLAQPDSEQAASASVFSAPAPAALAGLPADEGFLAAEMTCPRWTRSWPRMREDLKRWLSLRSPG